MRSTTIGTIRRTDVLFVLIILLAFWIGSYILTATFFGVLTLVGLIALIEAIGPLKWLLSRSTKLVDVIIFIFTILATMNYGLNISAALTVAGLGYTLVYAPRLRKARMESKINKQSTRPGNYRSKFNNK